MEAFVVTDYELRKLEGRCTRPGCPNVAADGVQLCTTHHDKQKQHQRNTMGRNRARWKRKRLCTRCGRKRATDSTWACPRCLIEMGRLRSVAVKHDVKQRAERIVAATSVDRDGRSRYHGRAQRGRQKVGDLDRQDFADAAARIAKAAIALEHLWSGEGQAKSRSERAEIRAEAMAQVALARRTLEDIEVRNGARKPSPDEDLGE